MKTLVIIFSVFCLLALNSCAQKTDVKAMLQDSEKRNEIFSEIVSDSIMMTSFMETMQNSMNAMRMMRGNRMMMGHMMKENGMNMMMKDSIMMGNMMQMMHKKGMLSKNCMDSSYHMMRMWKQKMNGMKMMDQEDTD